MTCSPQPGKLRVRLTQHLLAIATLVAVNSTCRAASFYTDCSQGVDGNGSMSAPWNSLADVNSHTFSPGDSVYFKRGMTCQGTLAPLGSGASGSPITIDAYGSGTLPVVQGPGSAASYGVVLTNQQYWTVTNLEVTNTDTSVPLGTASANILAGVEIIGKSNVGNLSGITLNGLYVHDVNSADAVRTHTGEGGGIIVEVLDASTGSGYVPTTFSNLLIENCHIRNVWANGIRSDSTWNDRPLLGTQSWPSGWTNVVVTGNRLEAIGGDGIIIQHTNKAVISHNNLLGANLHASYTHAGIWVWDANNTIIEYNESADLPMGKGDATGYDLDYNQDNTVIQYNYSHNNAGGFILNAQYAGPPYGTNATVRYNISLGDYIDSQPQPGGDAFYGNVTYYTAIEGANYVIPRGGDNIYISNLANPFTPSNCGTAPEDTQNTGYTSCSNNLFYDINPDSAEITPVTQNPLFANFGEIPTGITSLNAYRLLAGSPAIASGVLIDASDGGGDTPGSGNGGVDFYGNPVSSTAAPNIGADNSAGGDPDNLLQNPGFESGSLGQWGSWNSATVTSDNPHTGKYDLRLGAGPSDSEYNVTGLSPNATYTFSGWAKIVNSADSVSIKAKNFDAAGSVVGSNVTSTTYAQNWVSFTTDSTHTTATVYLYHPTGTGYAYGDDFFLKREFLSNPGFETSLLAPWTSTGSVVVNTTAPHSGTYALQLNQSSTVSQTVSGLQPNANYTFSGYAKVSASGQTITLSANSFNADGDTVSYPATSSTYQPVAINFTTGPGNPGSGSALVTVGTNSGSTGYVDDLAVNVNLVENPGFESGAFGGWMTHGGNVTREGSNAHTGDYAVNLDASGAYVGQQVCGLQPGATYLFGAWGMLSAAGDGAHILVENFDSSGTTLQSSLTTTSYAPYFLTFTMGPSNTCATFHLTEDALASGSPGIFFDDASLVLASPR